MHEDPVESLDSLDMSYMYLAAAIDRDGETKIMRSVEEAHWGDIQAILTHTPGS